MKKTCFFLLLALALGCMLPVAAEDVPPSLQSFLSPAAVTDAAHWEEAEKNTWFVVTKNADVNTLHCFTEENNHCTELFRTDDALPQGERPLALHLSEGAWDYTAFSKGRYIHGPILLVLQYDEGGNSVEQRMAFQRTGEDTWHLISLKNYPASINAKIHENSITYYGTEEKAKIKDLGTVPCFFETDLRTFRLANFPKNVQEAQAAAP